MEQKFFTTIDAAGNAVSGVSVRVDLAGTSTLATIYSDDGITTTANPLTSNSLGLANCYAADGRYKITFSGTGITTQTRDDVEFSDTESAHSSDQAWEVRDLTITTELAVPTSAPGVPANSNVWVSSSTLKHGAASKTVADLETAQTFTAIQTHSANVLPNATGIDLGSTGARFDLFAEDVDINDDIILGTGTTITWGVDVILDRSAADTLRLATGDSFIPQSSGQALGGASNRWALNATTGDFSGNLTLASGTTLTWGADTVLQRNSADVLGTPDTFAALKFTATQGTITSDAQAFSSTATWNSGGVTFVHLKANITDTASAAASLLIDLQVASTSIFKVSKSSVLTLGNDAVLQRAAANVLELGTGDTFRPQTSGDDLGATGNRWDLFARQADFSDVIVFGTSTTITWGSDVVLSRSAADTLQLATGDTFLPQTEGQFLGTSGKRWSISALDVDLTGVLVQNIPVAFADTDATPLVTNNNVFYTANTVATTITDFDGGGEGQVIYVIIKDANTVIDFTGTNLKGNAGVDWSPTTNDSMMCVYDGTFWYCRISDNTA